MGMSERQRDQAVADSLAQTYLLRANHVIGPRDRVVPGTNTIAARWDDPDSDDFGILCVDQRDTA